MKPYEPLRVEHGLINKLFKLIEREVERIKSSGRIDSKFIDVVSDFFITYVDVAHHGKEENILFQAMNKKNLTNEHKRVMNELLEEHRTGRRVIEELIKSHEAYIRGDENEKDNITARFKDFVDIYSKHITKEDNDYFIQVMSYFTEEEQDRIIQDFWKFDIKLVHEKYKEILSMLEEEM